MSPIGAVTAYAAATPPAGWLKCDGSLVSRATYPELFAVLGSTYGAGDGSTTFGLPDLSGRTIIGTGTATGAAGATAHTLAQKSGEETHVLAMVENTPHYHDVRSNVTQRTSDGITGVFHPQAQSALVSGQAGDGYHWEGPVAGSAFFPIGFPVSDTTYFTYQHSRAGVAITGQSASAHNNMQPYVAMTYIIKAFNGASPTSSTTGNSQKANLPITGDGVASVFTLYHTLQLKANEPFIGQVWEADSSGNPTKQAVGDILYNDFQTVKVSFSRPPANGAKYIVTVIG